MFMKDVQRERLKNYLECERKILINQSFQIGGRVYTRADLNIVRKIIQDLIDSGVTLEDEKNINGRSRRITFID